MLNFLKSKRFWTVFLFYLLMFLSIYAFAKITSLFIPKDPSFLLKTASVTSLVIGFFVLFAIIYFLALLFIYSFFKYKIIEVVRNKRHKASLKNFFLLNIVLYAIGVAVFFAGFYVLGFILGQMPQIVGGLLLLIYVILFYIISNCAQLIYSEMLLIKKSVKKSFSYLAKKEAWTIIVVWIVLLVATGVILYAIGAILDYSLANAANAQAYAGTFSLFSLFAASVVAIGAMALSAFMFYESFRK